MKITFNKQFMVLKFLLLKCFAKQITLKLTEAGTLPNKIGIGEKILVTNLKIIGEINGTDLRFIREMAGSDVKGNSTSGNLSVLDLSEAKFVAGGDYYYKDYEDGCYTSNDIIGKYAFRDCKSLTSVIIPSSVTEIREYAFDGCKYCSIYGDKGYIGADVQLDLFETAHIKLECPYRHNQKDRKPTFVPLAKARKRIETLFSQLTDQFLVIRNYAKITNGLFARIIGKISALTILQYVNFINNRPIGRIKYALN